LHAPVNDTFDPLHFLALARELGESDDENKLRTAAGRAYYAVYLIARDRLGVVQTNNAHAEVLTRLSRRGGTALQGQMFKLMTLRQVADYQLSPDEESCKNWKNNWIRQEKLAERLLPQIERM
jgi:hypothetical protein